MLPTPPLLLVVVAVLLGGVCSVADNSGAEQIHLSFTDDVTTIQVTYSTFQPVKASARYGTDQPDTLVEGSSTPFAQDAAGTHLQYINRVSLPGLCPGERHVYQVLGPAGWSEVFWFRAIPEGSDWSPRLAVVADMGTNPSTLPFLVNDTREGMYDAVLHVGDFAYDMFTDNGTKGDEFLRQIQPVAAHLPYMTCPGNHEQRANFSNYKNRFSMPGGTEGMYYSFNMGPVHFISISTEFYYFLEYGFEQVFSQYNWLRADLAAANQRSIRNVRPWIVLFGHRPMYCSHKPNHACTEWHDRLRVGEDEFKPALPGLEHLLVSSGVDLALWAHEHSYQRSWPVRDGTVTDTGGDPYRNPGAPVHITAASAGRSTDKKPENLHWMPWTAYRSSTEGYTRLSFHNATHLTIEQVAVGEDGAASVVDTVTIIKEECFT
ncbi:acid phosphatase type 7-like [Amphibalanus amphitrite]|uniref:acid phosphatase type 7-like n=1 Tax=Amphibalanus amphitrite TaxID=1232801 RepID=UPI001C8FDE73|nr:acid phosphatase type 7-like [Amphibalanus amphitrite]